MNERKSVILRRIDLLTSTGSIFLLIGAVACLSGCYVGIGSKSKSKSQSVEARSNEKAALQRKIQEMSPVELVQYLETNPSLVRGDEIVWGNAYFGIGRYEEATKHYHKLYEDLTDEKRKVITNMDGQLIFRYLYAAKSAGRKDEMDRAVKLAVERLSVDIEFGWKPSNNAQHATMDENPYLIRKRFRYEDLKSNGLSKEEFATWASFMSYSEISAIDEEVWRPTLSDLVSLADAHRGNFALNASIVMRGAIVKRLLGTDFDLYAGRAYSSLSPKDKIEYKKGNVVRERWKSGA